MGTTPLLLLAGACPGRRRGARTGARDSVRRCRRELAPLQGVGFVQRQLAAGRGVARLHHRATIGIGVGIPLGIVLGRWLWTLFADEIGAVPAPAVPVPSLLLAAIVALVLANAAAVVPGRWAARTATAHALHEE